MGRALLTPLQAPPPRGPYAQDGYHPPQCQPPAPTPTGRRQQPPPVGTRQQPQLHQATAPLPPSLSLPAPSLLPSLPPAPLQPLLQPLLQQVALRQHS